MQDFFPCGSSAPVRVVHEGGAAAWLAGTLAMQSVQGHRLPPSQELWPYLSLFLSLLYLGIRRPLCPVFSVAVPIQALRAFPFLGSFPVVQSLRHIEGLPWRGSYSVDRCIRHLKMYPGWGPTLVQCIMHLMGQLLNCSAADAGESGERLW